MQASEYLRLAQTELDHWWFRGLRLFLRKLLPIESRKGLRVLDLGSGTGALVKELNERGHLAFGADVSMFGLRHAKQTYQLANLVQADANFVPFDSVFDIVISVDLLEEGSVDPKRVVANIVRLLKPGGYALLAAAAHQWLMSEHDRAVNSVRRFTLRDLQDLFPGQLLEMPRKTYGFFLLFPLIAVWKLANRQKTDQLAISDVSMPPPFVNWVLFAVCALEAQILRFIDMPIGSTALVLVQKK